LRPPPMGCLGTTSCGHGSRRPSVLRSWRARGMRSRAGCPRMWRRMRGGGGGRWGHRPPTPGLPRETPDTDPLAPQPPRRKAEVDSRPHMVTLRGGCPARVCNPGEARRGYPIRVPRMHTRRARARHRRPVNTLPPSHPHDPGPPVQAQVSGRATLPHLATRPRAGDSKRRRCGRTRAGGPPTPLRTPP
jgi:hypothetical protein